MSSFLNYLWLILIALYIISPIDAHPLFLDDIIAAGILFYFIYKNSLKKRPYQQDRSQSSYQSGQNKTGSQHASGSLSIHDAYRLLEVTENSSWEEIQKAYKEKIAKSHPDKVNHLSKELQEKAGEITLRLNEAIDLIKRHRGHT